MRIKGHALTVEWNGEYGAESSSTGTCRCGWEESASNQPEVRFEYREHLKRVAREAGFPEENLAVWASSPLRDEGQTRDRHDAPDRWSRND